jgi:hypothetical protein
VRIADASRRSRAACSRAGPGGHRLRLVRWQWSPGANRAGGGTRTGAEPARRQGEPSSPRRRRQLLQRGEARRDARSCHLSHLPRRACLGGVASGLPGVKVRARGRAGRLGPTTPTTSSAPRAATATPPSLGSARLSGPRAQRHRERGHHGRAARRRLGTGLETGHWEPAVALLRRVTRRWPRVCRGWSPTAAGAEFGRAERWFRPPPHLDRRRRVIVAQLPNSRMSIQDDMWRLAVAVARSGRWEEEGTPLRHRSRHRWTGRGRGASRGGGPPRGDGAGTGTLQRHRSRHRRTSRSRGASRGGRSPRGGGASRCSR